MGTKKGNGAAAWQRIVTFGTLKGGTGKTMLATNIAAIASLGYRVLLVDADPQANATSNLGLDIRDLERGCITDVLMDPEGTGPGDVIVRAPVPGLPNLNVLPSNFLLAEAEATLFAQPARERIFSSWLARNARALSEYAYVIIDTNPSFGVVNQNMYAAADSIVMVTDVGVNGMLGAQVFRYLWEKYARRIGVEPNVAALVVNNVDSRIRLSSELVEHLGAQDDLAGLLVLPCVPSRVAFKRAEVAGVPLCVAEPDGGECRVLYDLMDGLVEKGVL